MTTTTATTKSGQEIEVRMVYGNGDVAGFPIVEGVTERFLVDYKSTQIVTMEGPGAAAWIRANATKR